MNLSQQAYVQASKATHYWLQRAAVLPPAQRVAFLDAVGRKVYPFFERDVNAAFLANMRQGMDAKRALQTALISVMQSFILNRMMGGMGTDKAGDVSASSWVSNIGNFLTSAADTTFGIISGVREQRAADQQASWERTMAETAAEHQRRMQELQLEQSRQASSQAPTVTQPQTILSAPPSDNTTLYIALGIGAVALIGGALILKK